MAGKKIGILHPGQMGVAVAETARNAGHEVYWVSAGRGAETARRAAAARLTDAATLDNLCAISEVIISICPPEFAEDTACIVAQQGFRGLYIDANAVSPDRVRRIAAMVSSAGATFVDGCVIGAPVRTRGETWIYLSGGSAAEAAECFGSGPLEVEAIAGDVGQASALKMCFAAHSKGMLALRAAVLAAARELGVFDSLERQWSRSGPPMDRAAEALQNAAPKAWRFVAEMYEIAATLESAGLPGEFHRAAAEIFSRMASFKGAVAPEFNVALDRLTRRS